MNFDILNTDEVDFTKITFTESNLSSLSKSLNIDYTYPSNNTDSLRIATPWIDLLSINDNSCLLSLKVMSNEPKMQNIYEFIKNFDKYYTLYGKNIVNLNGKSLLKMVGKYYFKVLLLLKQ